MRSRTIMLVTLGVLAAAGCGTQPPSPVPTGVSPTAVVPSPAPASPTGTDPAPPGTAPTSSTPPPTEDAVPPTEDAVPTPPSTVGDVPGGLPYGQRRATGVVEKSGTCTTLRVGARRWELTGSLTEGLADGSTVTVTGQVTTSTGCADDVVQTLVVQTVSPG